MPRNDRPRRRPPDTRPQTDKGLRLPCPFKGCGYVAESPRAQLKLDSHVMKNHPNGGDI